MTKVLNGFFNLPKLAIVLASFSLGGFISNSNAQDFKDAGALSSLILDLDGDGIEVTKMGFGTSASPVYFDMDNDEFAERTAWVTGGDGLLVWDRNGNGKIDKQLELFGNTPKFADGFSNLKSLDSNASGTITSADKDWANLKIWVDKNGSGISEGPELQTLSSLGITSINLNATAQTDVYINENRVSHISTFVMNGETKTIQDVWLRFDQPDSQYTGETTLDVKTLFLPTLKGFGNLKDLHVAMSQNPELRALVEKFTSDWTPSRFAQSRALNADVKKILFKWAGVDGYAAGSTLYGVDAKIYGFMKAITGQDHVDTKGLETTEPLSDSVIYSINAAYKGAFAYMKAALILQAGGSELFTDPPEYNVASGEMETKFTLDAKAITAAMAPYPTGPGGSEAWEELTAFLTAVKPVSTYTPAEIAILDAAGGGFSNYNNTWSSYASFVQGITSTSFRFAGTPQSDRIGGDKGNDIIFGNAGGDYLSGGDGNDTIDGGSGDDAMTGGTGDDLFIVDVPTDIVTELTGEGMDTIQSSVTLSLAENVENLTLTGSNLIDGTGNELNNNIKGNSSLNTIHGGNGNDFITGAAGNDIIYGDNGLDVLSGDEGLDTLYGGTEADTFKFTAGTLDGNLDIIKDYNEAQLDIINVQDLLVGYDPATKVITDYVDMATSGSDTILKVDRDGTGTTYGWVEIAKIENATQMTDEAALVKQGRLIAN